jgi:hypothetical protein
MLFQSLLRSSRLEILLSKRLTAALYFIFGLLVLVWWAFDGIQFLNAYQTLHAYDVSVVAFFLIEIILFMPLLLVGCFLLRNVLQRIRLNHWFKIQTNIPLYASTQSASTAGYLVDYEFGLAEAHAMLMSAYFRGNIAIVEQSKGFTVSLNNLRNVPQHEQVFLKRLFAEGNKVYLASLADSLVLSAAQKSHDHLMRQLQSEGFLPLTKREDRKFRPLVRLIYWVAGSIAALAAYAFIFAWDVVSSIGYPRYAVSVSQLWLTGAISVLGIAVLISGFWPRFTASGKSKLSAGWLNAAGFKYYLQNVFSDRLSPQFIHLQDAETVRLYVPYMVAFQLVQLDSSYVRAILQSQELDTAGRLDKTLES